MKNLKYEMGLGIPSTRVLRMAEVIYFKGRLGRYGHRIAARRFLIRLLGEDNG